jgi:hypothetical protein
MSNVLTQAMRGRLRSIETELNDLEQRRDKLLRLRETMEAAILQEEALSAGVADMSGVMPGDNPDAAFGDEEASAPSPRLSELVLAALATGPKSLGALKEILDSHFPEGANGRAINFALVGLQKGGHVQRQALTKTWRLPPSK